MIYMVYYVMQLAEHAKRIFLLRWSEMAPLEEWLEPSTFDWTVKRKHSVSHGGSDV